MAREKHFALWFDEVVADDVAAGVPSKEGPRVCVDVEVVPLVTVRVRLIGVCCPSKVDLEERMGQPAKIVSENVVFFPAPNE